jgi:hypothetical protein
MNFSFWRRSASGEKSFKKKNSWEEYFEPEQAQRILLLNQVRKEAFRIKVGKVRSNLILRIPKRIADALELKDGEEVTLRVEGNQQIMILTG